jgi:hypothetical protein
VFWPELGGIGVAMFLTLLFHAWLVFAADSGSTVFLVAMFRCCVGRV